LRDLSIDIPILSAGPLVEDAREEKQENGNSKGIAPMHRKKKRTKNLKNNYYLYFCVLNTNMQEFFM
jgi:hypothetical protein